MRRFTLILALPSLLSGSACSSESEQPAPGPWNRGAILEAEPQDRGDALRGRHTLLNGNYMSCGIPYKLWAMPGVGDLIRSTFGGARSTDVLPERDEKNRDMPFSMNAFTATDGTEVVQGNCLQCHGGKFDGQIIVGLGNATADYTAGLGAGAAGALTPEAMNALGFTAGEQAHMQKIIRLTRAQDVELRMRTVGNNFAEALTGVLVAHHDPQTLAWSEEPLTDVKIVDDRGQEIPDAILTSDPPPWWRAKKKHALFYNGMARGDHRGTMALATGVCVDDVQEAKRVDGLFRDIQAYIDTIVAPLYTRSIDQDLAAEGKPIFTRACAGCHGTYADNPENDAADSYPNLLLPLDVIGTDPVVANAGVVHAPDLVGWFNGSFYGQITPIVPDDPFPGYMAPPLDGVWATAPFFHNGSVPTLELVLNSKARPKYWKRVDFADTNFDEDAMGWPWVEVPYSQAQAPEAERKFIYDTTHWSQSNAGHTFGDALGDNERRALIEYLKTL